jgi:hypothetical protein
MDPCGHAPETSGLGDQCSWPQYRKLISRTPSHQGGLEWTIEDWSTLSKDIGVPTTSPEFTTAGFVWTLSIYPGGHPDGASSDQLREKALEFVAIELHRLGPPVRLQYSYHIRLLNKRSAPRLMDKKISEHNAGHTGASYPRLNGAFNLIERAELMDESLGYKIDDTVSIIVDLTTYGDMITLPVPSGTPPPLSSTLASDILGSLESRSCTDITIRISPHTPESAADMGASTTPFATATQAGSSSDVHFAGNCFRAHRFILKARSPYFDKMLESPMRESTSDHIDLHGVDPSAFRVVLTWIYSDRAPTDPDLISASGEEVLITANLLGCAPLEQYCEALLAGGVNIENAARRLVLSDGINAGLLKGACINFIFMNLTAVFGTSGWRDLVSNNQVALIGEVMSLLTISTTQNQKKRKKRKGNNGQ